MHVESEAVDHLVHKKSTVCSSMRREEILSILTPGTCNDFQHLLPAQPLHLTSNPMVLPHTCEQKQRQCTLQVDMLAWFHLTCCDSAACYEGP